VDPNAAEANDTLDDEDSDPSVDKVKKFQT